MYRKPIASGIVLLFILSSIIPMVSSDTPDVSIIYVDDDGGADYIIIQDAIDNANDGDTIFVYSGVYHENIIIDKSITLQGEDRNTTIVDGGGENDTILVTAEWVTVCNFGVTNSGSNRFIDSGIHINASYTTLINNYIFNNVARGIIVDSNYNIISENQVYDNRLGIITHYGIGNIIINNFVNMTLSNGIYFAMDSYKNTMYKNKVTNSNNALLITDSNDNLIRGNIADSSEEGLEIDDGRRNIVYDNTFSNNSYAGIEVENYNDNTIYHNNFIKNNNNNINWPGGNQWYLDYPIGGNYWDDYFNGSDDYHGPNQDIPGGDGIWDDPYIISISLDIDKYPYKEPDGWVKEPDGPDLDCLGMLSWKSVKPNTEQTGRICIFNNGESGSMLDWKVEGLPDWGGCIVTPDHGEDLSPEDGYVALTITITSPDEQDQSFSGEIKIVNKENSSDYHVFTVSLTTAKTKNKSMPIHSFILQFLEDHPRLFPLLQLWRRMF